MLHVSGLSIGTRGWQSSEELLCLPFPCESSGIEIKLRLRTSQSRKFSETGKDIFVFQFYRKSELETVSCTGSMRSMEADQDE